MLCVKVTILNTCKKETTNTTSAQTQQNVYLLARLLVCYM